MFKVQECYIPFFPQIVWENTHFQISNLMTFLLFKQSIFVHFHKMCILLYLPKFLGCLISWTQKFLSLQTRILFWVSHFLDTKRPFCHKLHFAIGLKINWLYLKSNLPFEDKFFFKCWIKSSWSYFFWHKIKHIFTIEHFSLCFS